jgi:dihydrofolate reductase
VGDVVLDMTMSLDGFVAAPGDGRGRALGAHGELLHDWVFGGSWSYEGSRGRPSGVDRVALAEAVAGSGASVIGRRTYDLTGGWGAPSPLGRGVVVTHRVADEPGLASELEFVDGLEAAIRRARELARDRSVHLGGGADVARQALRAGLVDALRIHVAPVILGGGRSLFATLGARLVLEPVRVMASARATHLWYRVVR